MAEGQTAVTKERVILHSDLNNFYASVECLLDPFLQGKAVAVCGDPKARHGIVLAKSEQAKKCGVKTAEPIWQAQKKCPELVLVGTHFAEYGKYSLAVREIYERFTDYVEAFSIDECWLDVTESGFLFGSGKEIAEKIRKSVREELGLTVSVGVSFNKSLAKMASDMKKPDAVTVIDREHFQEKVYPLPVSDLLYVGKSTQTALQKVGIRTVGDLAACDDAFIEKSFGKLGLTLLSYARGEENESVRKCGEERQVKSIGNSFTLPRDTIEKDEIRRLLFVLSEGVAERLIDSGVGKADTVHIVVKDKNFVQYTWQKKVPPTLLVSRIANSAYELFEKHYVYRVPVRMLGVSVSGFTYNVEQLFFGKETEDETRKERAARAVSYLRKKYGYEKIQRGVALETPADEKPEIKKLYRSEKRGGQEGDE